MNNIKDNNLNMRNRMSLNIGSGGLKNISK